MINQWWQAFGTLSVVGFIVAVVLSFIARGLFVSKREKDVKLGTQIISAVGGARNARSAREENVKRRIAM
jgi:hypothetical protein